VGVQAAPNHVGDEHFQLQLQGLDAITMLQWETVHGRDRAPSGKREYRVFYGLEEGSHTLLWTLVVREVEVKGLLGRRPRLITSGNRGLPPPGGLGSLET
jgi:hypothetical protein